MNRQRCIRELRRHGLQLRLQHRATIRLHPLFLRTPIAAQFYTTIEISQTVVQSSETIPSPVCLNDGPRPTEPFPKPEKVSLVPLPSYPYHSESVFFQYYDQRTSLNKSPQLEYANTVGSANYLLRRIKGRVLGLDLEWRVQGPINVSLLQVCDEHTILLLHLTPMKGLSPAPTCPYVLKHKVNSLVHSRSCLKTQQE